jgi:hypothetical protein
MLMNKLIESDDDQDSPLSIFSERRQSPRHSPIRTRARLAWRTHGLRVAKAPAQLIDISEGGLSVSTRSPAPSDQSYFWVGLEALPNEWVKAALCKAVKDGVGWVYHCVFLETCAPGIIERVHVLNLSGSVGHCNTLATLHWQRTMKYAMTGTCEPTRTSRIRPRRRTRRHAGSRLRMESLEGRSLLATLLPAVPLTGPVPNETLDQAINLGDLSNGQEVAVPGSIGNGPYGGADVEWYGFTLDHAMLIDAALAQASQGGAFQGLLSLYNNDPWDFQDPYNPDGYRLLEQQGGSGTGGAAIARLLGPGTYDMAVSGAGNADFHPLLAGSGYTCETGNFLFKLSAVDTALGPSDGPAVLTTDPARYAVLASSPFEIRIGLSGALDPTTILAGQDVQLTYNPDGHFGDGSDQPVALNSYNPVNFSSAADELQITPGAPLAPGYY